MASLPGTSMTSRQSLPASRTWRRSSAKSNLPVEQGEQSPSAASSKRFLVAEFTLITVLKHAAISICTEIAESKAVLRPRTRSIRHTVITMTQERFNLKPRHTSLMPLRLRDLFGILAVLLGLIVQTTHTHAGPARVSVHGKGHAVLAASNSNSDICPLCVAMHSASPARPATAPIPSDHLTTVRVGTHEQFVQRPPAYIQYSRPPPNSSR